MKHFQEQIQQTPAISEQIFTINSDDKVVAIQGRHFVLNIDRRSGKISKVAVFDGIAWNDILADRKTVGDNWELPVSSCEITEETADQVKLDVVRESASWRLEMEYEISRKGSIICTFSVVALTHNAEPYDLRIGIPLDEQKVFSKNYKVKNTDNDVDLRQSIRGLALDFSCDQRPVTNSLDFMLESVTHDMNSRSCRRVYEKNKNHRFMGWNLSTGWQYPFPKGYKYENRWCMSLTALDNSPNKVRAQRIYHFYGINPVTPPDELLEEMAEYGCSILIMHTPFQNISGSIPLDKEGLRHIVEYAHKLGIKVLPYCTPNLISHEDPAYNELLDCRTDCLNVWVNLNNSQTCTFEYHSRWDADELCLRCDNAYQYVLDNIKECHEEFGFDGLYIDFCWPAQGLCTNGNHKHKSGLFNYYDYLRIIKDLRTTIGSDKIMIGHGGGFLVASDVIEGFDACLTGEAQVEMDPITIGQQYGTAPTLWPIQRRKHDIFRSDKTIEQLIKQGMTPHCGIGSLGTAIISTLDPAHHVSLIALWQMWRAFPVQRATFYNYLTDNVVTLDNNEVFYSMYITAEGYVLLILVNAGGPELENAPGIGVETKINIEKLGLSNEMKCWRMKGSTYETFRIEEIEKVKSGIISVPLLDLHEFVGFVLSPGSAPEELTNLITHLQGRGKRLGSIYDNKVVRLKALDNTMDQWAKLPTAVTKIKYDEFMRSRVAE